MKKTLLLVLATALTAVPALALDMGGEVFLNHKATLTENAKTEGTDVERLRVFMTHKFNDQWQFKGRFDIQGDAVKVKEAHFHGTGILMDGDTVRFGAQPNPAFTHENSLGNRWITKPSGWAELFTVDSWQTGASYTMKLAGTNVTLFSLSGEPAGATDTTDNQKLNGAMVDYKVNDAIMVYVQHAALNEGGAGVAAGAAEGTNILTVGLNYRSEAMDLGAAYHSASYTVNAPAVAPKANTVLGLSGLFKKLAGTATNLYAHVWTGYDKFADTGENTESKIMVGPTWKVAEKIDLGVFYEMEKLQADFKTPNPNAKDPSALYVKMAAKF